MNSTYKRYIGHRGTTKAWGEKCKREADFYISKGDDEYFGHGIYFFEDDDLEAENWAKCVRKIKIGDISIIEALIESDEDKVFDLTKTRVFNEYMNLVDIIAKRYKEGSAKQPQIKKPYDCKIINMICDKKGIQLVRGPYKLNHKLARKLGDDNVTRLNRIHIQLCVRDKAVIKETKVRFL